ncbi:MAG: flagellar export protein FliJ [Muribaculaceae bacterium]|nr:flagellar export protein FliJ [Roseburia sp.]MCM1431075.1 flagellar export protein FliJ [Muribaculaceae bacterium]MCM1493335.1 flagellar export protein FliJ [Muribaculaceae bacterium]
MAKFVYRMQNILDIKEKLETQAQMAFALANQAYMEEQEKLQALLVRRVGYEKRLKELMAGTIDVKSVTNARADVNAMKTIVRRQMMEVHKAERELEDARQALNEVMQERKVQEKLREKAFDEFKHELAVQETKEIDELVSYTFNHR